MICKCQWVAFFLKQISIICASVITAFSQSVLQGCSLSSSQGLCLKNVNTERNDLLLQSHHSMPAKSGEQVIFFFFFYFYIINARHLHMWHLNIGLMHKAGTIFLTCSLPFWVGEIWDSLWSRLSRQTAATHVDQISDMLCYVYLCHLDLCHLHLCHVDLCYVDLWHVDLRCPLLWSECAILQHSDFTFMKYFKANCRKLDIERPTTHTWTMWLGWDPRIA